jgi:hypothetical protein
MYFAFPFTSSSSPLLSPLTQTRRCRPSYRWSFPPFALCQRWSMRNTKPVNGTDNPSSLLRSVSLSVCVFVPVFANSHFLLVLFSMLLLISTLPNPKTK